MERTIKFGKHAVYSKRRVNAVDVDIRLKYNDNGRGCLSISASVWNSAHTDIVMGGQCLDELMAIPSLSRNKLFVRVYNLWKRWHLNNLKAGCEHQRVNWDLDKKIIVRGKEVDASDTFPSEHPEGLLAKPCEVCGYKYGTAWLLEELPVEIEQEIIDIIEGKYDHDTK